MPIGGDDQLTFNINFFTNATPVLKTATRQGDSFITKTNASLARSQGTFKSLRGGLEKTGLAVNRLAGRWIAMGATMVTTLAVFKSIGDAQKFGIAIAEIGTIFSGTSKELQKVETDIAVPVASVRITPSATKIVDWQVTFEGDAIP